MKPIKTIKKESLTSNDILNLLPENRNELEVLQTLVQLVKKELKESIVSNINHLTR